MLKTLHETVFFNPSSKVNHRIRPYSDFKDANQAFYEQNLAPSSFKRLKHPEIRSRELKIEVSFKYKEHKDLTNTNLLLNTPSFTIDKEADSLYYIDERPKYTINEDCKPQLFYKDMERRNQDRAMEYMHRICSENNN